MSHISWKDKIWQLFLTWRRPKKIWITRLCRDILKSENFAIWENADIICILVRYFQFFLPFLFFFLIVVVTILMMWAKLASPGLLKIKIFRNKDYGIIIFDYDVTKEILSRNSNYIMDVVMWPKFGNSSMSIRKIIITSIL